MCRLLRGSKNLLGMLTFMRNSAARLHSFILMSVSVLMSTKSVCRLQLQEVDCVRLLHFFFFIDFKETKAEATKTH